jgi:transposase
MKKLTREQYENFDHILPVQRGNVVVDNFTFLLAIQYVLENGIKWRSLPEKYGKWSTIHKRYSRWVESGVIHEVFEYLMFEELGVPNFIHISIDSTSFKVHPDAHGANKKRGRKRLERQ